MGRGPDFGLIDFFFGFFGFAVDFFFVDFGVGESFIALTFDSESVPAAPDTLVFFVPSILVAEPDLEFVPGGEDGCPEDLESGPSDSEFASPAVPPPFADSTPPEFFAFASAGSTAGSELVGGCCRSCINAHPKPPTAVKITTGAKSFHAPPERKLDACGRSSTGMAKLPSE